jgi:hypothetical protein
MAASRFFIAVAGATFVLAINIMSFNQEVGCLLPACEANELKAGAIWKDCLIPKNCKECSSTTNCAAMWAGYPGPYVAGAARWCQWLNGKDGCSGDLSAKICMWICYESTCANDQHNCGQKRKTGCGSYVPNPAVGDPHCPCVACHFDGGACGSDCVK